MNQLKAPEKGYESRVRTNVIQLFRWTGAWAGTCMLMAVGPTFLWNKSFVFTLLAIGLNVCVGIGTIVVNKKYLDELDELQRKVYFNSLAITVGVAMIAGVPYSVMDSLRVIPFHADVAHLVALMGLTYGASTIRYTAVSMKNRLKVLRAERDWTQAELADVLDVSRQTINAIETGKFDPSLPLAFRIARLFGLRIEEIFSDPMLDKDGSGLATEIRRDTPV